MAFELAVLLAAHNVDLHLAMTALAAKCVTLAPEQELGNRFSDRELRAIPPLGSDEFLEPTNYLPASSQRRFGNNLGRLCRKTNIFPA